MPPAQLCAICHKRKPKRHCPGVRGEICAICCGTEREVTVDCPYDCPYLRESRRHQKLSALPEKILFDDIEIPDSFLYEHEQLVSQIAFTVLRRSLEDRSVVDNTVSDALDKLIRTYQTQQSGIYYESVPENPAAIGVFRAVKTFLEPPQDKQGRAGSVGPVKDSDAIRAFAFLYRLAAVHGNGRPLGRAFLDFLRHAYPQAAEVKQEPRLIIPGA